MTPADKFQVWPLFRGDDGKFNLDDDLLISVWDELESSERYKDLFHAGDVNNADMWLAFLRAPGNFPAFVFDTRTRKIVIMAWLNGISPVDRTAFAHFTAFGPYLRGSGEAMIDYWFSLRGFDGRPIFLTLLGVTPEKYTAVLKLLKLLNWHTVGTIPKLCYLHYENCMVGGVVSYYSREG